MHHHIRSYILAILLACIIIPAHAQKKGYTPGYIINLEGETIEGQVKDRSTGTFIELYKRIRFKPENARSGKKYSPDDILAYGTNDQHFESVPLYEETSFFKFRYFIDENYDRIFLRLISNDADLAYFHWEYVDSESNYLDYIPLFYREGSDEMVRVTQGILGLKRRRLMEYFGDCPDLAGAIYEKQLNGLDEVYNFYVDRCANEHY